MRTLKPPCWLHQKSIRLTGSIEKIYQCCRSCHATKGLELLFLPKCSIIHLIPSRASKKSSGRILVACFWSWATGTSTRCVWLQSFQTAPWDKALMKRFRLGGIPKHQPWPNTCSPKAGDDGHWDGNGWDEDDKNRLKRHPAGHFNVERFTEKSSLLSCFQECFRDFLSVQD